MIWQNVVFHFDNFYRFNSFDLVIKILLINNNKIYFFNL